MEELEGTYLYLFLNTMLLRDDPLAALGILMLFLARILPIITQAPFFGAKVLPASVKMMLALMLFCIFLPQLLTVTTTRIGFSIYTLVLLMKELFVGVLLGYFISLPFSIAQTVGLIVDHQRGGASLMVNDPTIQNQSSPLGTFFNMVLIFLFFYIEGPFILLNALIEAYEILPPDKLINPNFFDPASASMDMIVKLFNKIMVISMQLASPSLLAILMTDVFLGIANRLAPQVQITFLGMPLKSLLALVVVCFGWRLFNEELVRQTRHWLDDIGTLISMLTAGT